MFYAFAEYSLDPDRRELRRGAEVVAVEPQAFDLLLYLVQNRQRVVGKDDLIAAVWKRRIVSDSTLSSQITNVRHAIGDGGGRQLLIRTLPRKGFRFVGEVQENHEKTQDHLTEQIERSAPKSEDSGNILISRRPAGTAAVNGHDQQAYCVGCNSGE